eukprot:UN01842
MTQRTPTPIQMELMVKMQNAMMSPAPAPTEDYQRHMENSYHRKMVKYNTLGRYYVDLQRDPTFNTRIHYFPMRAKPHDPHSGIPYSELAMAVGGSIVFAGVLGLIGGFFAVGNIPNSHVFDHYKPTIAQQFRHTGRFFRHKMTVNAPTWTKIGVFLH